MVTAVRCRRRCTEQRVGVGRAVGKNVWPARPCRSRRRAMSIRERCRSAAAWRPGGTKVAGCRRSLMVTGVPAGGNYTADRLVSVGFSVAADEDRGVVGAAEDVMVNAPSECRRRWPRERVEKWS